MAIFKVSIVVVVIIIRDFYINKIKLLWHLVLFAVCGFRRFAFVPPALGGAAHFRRRSPILLLKAQLLLFIAMENKTLSKCEITEFEYSVQSI